MEQKQRYNSCNFKNAIINSKKIIFATNGFLKSLGIKSNYNFPITLTASMTRSLTEEEFRSIGQPKEWGVLPVRPMGATIRMTKDRRILIRNTAEVHNPFKMSRQIWIRDQLIKKLELKKDFHNYLMILSNFPGLELSLEQEIVLKYLKKLITMSLLPAAIMDLALVLALYLANKLQLKQAMKTLKK